VKIVDYKAEHSNLFKQVVDLEVHLENRLFAAFVVKGDNESSRRRRSDVEVDVDPSIAE
jgi:hypothetical protein